MACVHAQQWRPAAAAAAEAAGSQQQAAGSIDTEMQLSAQQ
jgi:hypothetical protein